MKLIAFLLYYVSATLAAPPSTDSESHLQELAIGNQRFAAAVYKEIQKKDKKNLIFSPFSAETVLALTSAGAKGTTRQELIGALRLPEDEVKIQKGFKELLPQLKINSEEVRLLSANKIYANQDVKLEDEFKNVAVNIFDAGVENVNFENAVESAGKINNWVEQQTNNRIKKLVSADQLNSDTVLVLVNAIFLSANWRHEFKEFRTSPQKFYVTATETVDKPTMQQTNYFQYYDNKELNAQFLVLPFEHRDLNMIIALPNDKDGVNTLEGNIDKVFEAQPWTFEAVELKLPKFTIESSINFVDILKAQGVEKLFGGNKTDLTGLSSTHKNLVVSGIVQKAFIKVDESGCEAAAATAVLVESRSGRLFPQERKYFNVDHPFLYVIKYKDVILFAGKYNS